jgi:protein-L-isoaspartate(D-aspartate) O-methyltransferase
MSALSFAGGAAVLALTALCALLAPILAAARAEPPGTAAPAPPSPTPVQAARGDTEAARRARRALVAEVARQDPQVGRRVLEVLAEVPRHLFMPGADVAEAYGNHAFPIGHGQTISQPTVVAIMSDALELDGTERVLEVGTGSGYQAAVLSRLAREVWSIEIVAPLGEEARARLTALGYANVHVRVGDGYAGWPEAAPFDAIILTAAPPELPESLVAQLREGGVLVAPLGTLDQHLYRWRKRDGTLEREHLGAVRFVPMVSPKPGP